jgi:hypothetical protein
MQQDNAAIQLTLSDDDVQTCVRVLRAIEADRSHLARLTQEQRRELLTLSGLVAKPERHDLVKLARAFRRAKRETEKENDRQAIQKTGQRMQRRATAYTPLWLEPSPPKDPAGPKLAQERACYVCKQPFATMHRYYDSMCESLRRLQLRQARADRRSERPLRSGHRCSGENRLSSLAETSACRRARHRHHALSRRRGRPVLQEPDYASFSARLQIHGLDLRHTPSVEFSRGSCSNACRGSTTFSTTPAKPCGGRRAFSSICLLGKRNP